MQASTGKPLYKRVLLKLSGEALMGDSEFGIDPSVLDRFAREIRDVVNHGVQVGVVLGGGNLFRGKTLSIAGLGRVTGDHMGMLATVMNGLALRDSLEKIDLPSRIMSAIPMTGVVDPYNRRKAITHLHNERVVIFSAGTGNPFFTTDTAACLRAIEVDADIVLKATKVDGVYSSDPEKDKSAERFDYLTYDEVLRRDLKVMDLTAICMCRDYGMPLRVFSIKTPGILEKIIFSEKEGTKIGAHNAE
jgi:uridylate kinase